MNAIAIIQARLGSTRLPGKVLADINGQALLGRLITRVNATEGLNQVVVATTTEKSDDVLVDWCNKNCIEVFRGSKNDVLDRFWNCSKTFKADIVVRVTADDPLKDPHIISKALELCVSNNEIDYVSNTLNPTFPEGLDIEVFKYRALEKAAVEAKLISEREHVTPYIWKNPQIFNLCDFTMEPNLSSWRWTVDKPADLELVRLIFKHFDGNPLVSYKEVIAWINKNPEILLINSGTIRHEGYFKTLAEEQNNE